MNTPLTREHIRRVNQAIEECDRYIKLESPRSADLRPPEIAKRLEFYIQHRAKLVKTIGEENVAVR